MKNTIRQVFVKTACLLAVELWNYSGMLNTKPEMVKECLQATANFQLQICFTNACYCLTNYRRGVFQHTCCCIYKYSGATVLIYINVMLKC